MTKVSIIQPVGKIFQKKNVDPIMIKEESGDHQSEQDSSCGKHKCQKYHGNPFQSFPFHCSPKTTTKKRERKKNTLPLMFYVT